jgi:hypothetical protein
MQIDGCLIDWQNARVCIISPFFVISEHGLEGGKIKKDSDRWSN